jgi:UDP-GlcNAc:undecaprenyl-phosphate GlcNAc-1-phosphate transferase
MLVAAIIAGFLLSAATSYYLTPIVTRLAHERRWVDDPDGGRKMHSTPIPRTGGLAIVCAFLVGLSLFAVGPLFLPPEILPAIRLPSPAIIFGALMMAAVGFYDDIRGLHFGPKFAMQVGAALLLVAGGIRIYEIFDPFSGQPVELPLWLSVTITIVWVVGAINAINLLDGMDGLASGVSVIAFGSMTAAYFVLGDWTHTAWIAIIVGAVTGFLRYNFNPAQIFMGDSGSMFLGFLIAAYSLRGASRANSLLALMIPLIAMGLPVMDTGLTIVRRFLERRHIFHADGDHIHHRLAKKMGLSHRNTVLVLYAISVFFGLAAFLLAISDKEIGDSILAPVVLIVTGLGIFALLKSLGYLVVPKRDLEEHSNGADPGATGQQGVNSSDVVEMAQWDSDSSSARQFSVSESSHE